MHICSAIMDMGPAPRPWSLVSGPHPLCLDICASRAINRQSIGNMLQVILLITCRIYNSFPRTNQNIDEHDFLFMCWIASPFRIQTKWADRVNTCQDHNISHICFVRHVYRYSIHYWIAMSTTKTNIDRYLVWHLKDLGVVPHPMSLLTPRGPGSGPAPPNVILDKSFKYKEKWFWEKTPKTKFRVEF